MEEAVYTTSKENIYSWKAAVLAGLIAGFVFIVMEMVLVATAGGGSLWAPPRMIAAIWMGQGVLPPPASFDWMIFTVAMLIHFALSILYAFILAWIIKGLGMGLSMIAGVIFGLAIYVVNFYALSAYFFPWFTGAQNWITIISHITFGLILAWAYKGIAAAGKTTAPGVPG